VGDAGEANGAGFAGWPETPTGGGGLGGAADDGGSEAGAGGMGGSSDTPSACPAGYIDWLKSTFSFPDGDIVGTADFPSLPWASSGSLEIDAGRLTGVGTATINQGVVIPYADARLRFRARFTSADQKVTIAFDAAANGAGGVRVTLDSAGNFSLTEGKALVGDRNLAPLETGVDWFVEAMLSSAGVEISLARASYGTEKQAKIEATLSTGRLKGAATGATMAVELSSASGIVPSIDELSVAPCDLPAPAYEPRLIDTFERPDSDTLGKPEFPGGIAWSSSSTSIKIIDGALQTAGELKIATIPLQVPLTGLRVRTTLKPVAPDASFWADVNINVTQSINQAQGFWVWGDSSAFTTGLFTGGSEVKHDVQWSGEKLYVQMDRDGDVAVITVREQSFDGPILGAQYAGALLPNAEPGGFFSLADEGGAGVRFEDVRVDNYPAE